MALSARVALISWSWRPERGIITVEPAFRRMPFGMLLISRSVSASTFSRAASASIRSRLSTVTADQLDNPPR
ncbi:hypothetical protein D3C80_2005870 [compost metagenome]